MHIQEKSNVPASNARFIATKSQESLDSRHEGDKSVSDSGMCRQLGTGQDKLPKERGGSPIVGAARMLWLLVVPGEEPGACWGSN